MIKFIKAGQYEETLKDVTKTWKWTPFGYVDELGNLLKSNKDHSKVIKFTEIPKHSSEKESN